MTPTPLPRPALPMRRLERAPSSLSVQRIADSYALLPPERRRRVTDVLLREVAAVRILLVYPAMLAAWGCVQALEETADAVNADMGLPVEAGGFEVSARYVKAVTQEGR